MAVTVEPLRTVNQLKRYFGLVLPAITEYYNRRGGDDLPRHQTEVHHAIERAFLGTHPVELANDSLTTCSDERMSEFLSRVEAHFSNLGVHFESEGDHP